MACAAGACPRAGTVSIAMDAMTMSAIAPLILRIAGSFDG
jgi:hypothetical protein